MKLILAYDGSEWANAAIDELSRAGLPRDTEALVVSVADVGKAVAALPLTLAGAAAGHPPSTRTRPQRLASEALDKVRVLAEQAAARLRSLFPAWRVEALACAGSPPEEIIRQAEERQADLIVVGACGHSALGRVLFGSVSQKVMRYAPCSVRVARRRDRSRGDAVRIVVGLDGSDGATAALRAVASRAWPAGSEGRAVVALDLRLATSLPTIDDDGEAWAQRLAGDAVTGLEQAGLSAASILRRGDPKHVLMEEAAQWGADCIFVGARGMSQLARFMLGGVSSAVAAHAHCSVEVIRIAPSQPSGSSPPAWR